MTQAEKLVEAFGRGFATGLAAAEKSAPAKTPRDDRPAVIPVEAIRATIQEALPGILGDMLAQADGEAPPGGSAPFGAGVIEDDESVIEARRRAQGEAPATYDPNAPGASGWRDGPT